MPYLLIISFAGLFAGFYLTEKSGYSTFFEFIGVVLGVISVVAFLVSMVCGVFYYGAGYKAEIINREYGTSYTREEVFYAGDVIDTIRQLQRQRIEVNGDLLKEK